MERLPTSVPHPRPYGFSRTPNLKGMLQGSETRGDKRSALDKPSMEVVTLSATGDRIENATTVGGKSDATGSQAGEQVVSQTPSAAALSPTDDRFVIRVACDVGSRKVNIEIRFQSRPPTMPKLLLQLERTLVWDWMGDGRITPISISHLLIWADAEWRYLCNPKDLDHGDQIYVFQKYQQRYSQEPLPPPRFLVDAGEKVNFRDSGSLRVAADLYGKKVNFEIRYQQLPSTIDELRLDCERLMSLEGLYHKPEGCPAHDVVINRFALWDEGLDAWLNLTTAQSLENGQQLYCHQASVVEDEGGMPPPTCVIPGGSMLSDLWNLYNRIDVNHTGAILLEDLSHTFAALGLNFPNESYIDMFESCDLDHDGMLCFSEFSQIGLLYPSIVGYLIHMAEEFQLYWKQRATFLQKERINRKELLAAREKESSLRAVESELQAKRREYDAEHRVMLASIGIADEEAFRSKTRRQFRGDL
eukprot:TRINITY_DN34831_c0_g1_i1.p1 TRINITY_DN34831_c0_g1~~TRINITY_DN34831_c0_g1_i1.p1  ORF type:complete len:474 (+),score=90.77 TRINITY_DN34831_c0_g1_i1:45-1466(+)